MSVSPHRLAGSDHASVRRSSGLAFGVYYTRHTLMAVGSPVPAARAFGLSLDWTSLLVALILAAFVRFGILGNVPW